MAHSDSDTKIEIKGARVHNLKNVSITLPHQKLIVFTGPSGSGKSSLAFDTLHAEGQRRYIETFSTYARQFLSQVEKPDVDELTGLSPTIAILQKTTSHNPRSTVGTTTEIYDHLRLLYARIATPFCPQCDSPISSLTTPQMLERVLAFGPTSKLTLLAPIAREKKGEFQKELLKFRQKGFTKARINGEIKDLSDPVKLDKNYKHNIEIIVDRVILKNSDEHLHARLLESIESALSIAKGTLIVLEHGSKDREHFFSQNFACTKCDLFLPEPEPRLFSFNSPIGACKRCDGVGFESFQEEAEDDESDDQPHFSYHETCKECHGLRLSPQSRAYKVRGLDIATLGNFAISDIPNILNTIELSDRDTRIAGPLIKELLDRLQFLNQVGVGYLDLNRPLFSLSGGESQRIRLASQLGSALVGITYILDEPSIGLHPRDNHLLIESLKKLRDQGNTVIVVEHDEETMRASDLLVDIGPGAGRMGGQIVAMGTPTEVLASDQSLTADFLSGKKKAFNPKNRRKVDSKKSLHLEKVNLHNLKNLSVQIPIGVFNVVTGVSGGGKSSLIMDTLYPLLLNHFHDSKIPPMTAKISKGLDLLDKVVQIDQNPIGRTPRSNPATYTGLFSFIRNLFAELPEAKLRGFKPGRFSFNVKGGRCDDCEGDGLKKITMNFMPNAYYTCETCRGARFKPDTLQVQFKGKNIAEVLDLSVSEGVEFFRAIPTVYEKLKLLDEVGLGYIKLGQPATTLSGGEAQRIKLAKELSKRATGKTLYILDEPSTGLHFEDIRKLLSLLNRLVDQGNTVVVIEHNLDVISASDHVIDLGPEGGAGGGKVVAEGTPEQIAKNPACKIAPFLKTHLAG